MTREWDLFIESVESPSREWSNSFDCAALSTLHGEERERAIEMLLLRMSVGDWRASRALGRLSDPRVRTALEAHLPEATEHDKMATANALLQQSPDHAAAIEAVKQGLASAEILESSEALNAAELVGKPILDDLLATAVTQPRERMRIGAIKLALFLTGVNKSRMVWDHRELIVGLATGDADERRRSFAKLCALMSVDLTDYRGPRP
ncbi:MAG TPA: hypothetical protein VFG30_01320 [Polyangiales bacterium]|nr:hypothetical protein [Polyangiales bacterium]